jgi:ATP-dependent Clp protease protease subunit
MKIHAERMIKIKERMNRILSLNTGQRLSVIENDTERDNFLDPEDAVNYGLIDKVITKR